MSPDGNEFTGPNLMGRLLMELRDNGSLEYRLPEDMMDFSDLKGLEPEWMKKLASQGDF